MTKELTTMTVGELIQRLQEFSPDTPALFAFPSHDYWGRTLASPIGYYEVEESEVEWSGYHDQWSVSDGESPEEGAEERKLVVLIGA